jgi:hypothetical protein
MDPIHPIAPLPPNIPPVSPAPMAGGVDRDGARRNQDPQQRHRRRPQSEPAAHASVEGADYYLDDVEDDDGDSGLHISVTA